MQEENNDDFYQAHQYDKIWRENMRASLPGIIEKILKIDVAESRDLPDKVLITKQREVDLLQQIVDKTGNSFVLHLEIQTQDDADMVYRMAEYSVMIEREYRMPVKQYVIYTGKGKSKMNRILKSDHLYFEYHIISLSQVPYKLFLSSDRPEEQLLSILGNFEGEDSEVVLSDILRKVHRSSKGILSEDRYIQQLRILIQLRNLAKQFNHAMEKVSQFFKEEKDPFYQRGVRKGREDVVRNLIVELGLSDEQTARIAGVSVEFVNKVRASLNND